MTRRPPKHWKGVNGVLTQTQALRLADLADWLTALRAKEETIFDEIIELLPDNKQLIVLRFQNNLIRDKIVEVLNDDIAMQIVRTKDDSSYETREKGL